MRVKPRYSSNADVTINSADATDGQVIVGGLAAGDGRGGAIVLNTTAAVFGIGSSASSKVTFFTEVR